VSILLKQIATASKVIEEYDFKQPFHLYLSNVFKSQRQMGSKDRKIIREACYAFFRWGNLFNVLTIEDKIRLSFARKNLLPYDFETLQNCGLNIQNEEELTNYILLNSAAIFPCNQALSSAINKTEFHTAHLSPGKVFFRFTHKGNWLKDKLPAHITQYKDNIYYTQSATNLNEWVQSGYIQIQDLSSQEVCKQIAISTKVWDICTGSGGKLLHLQELFPSAVFYASDIRPQILHKLLQRSNSMQVKLPSIGAIDIGKPQQQITFKFGPNAVMINKPYFKTIIADVPCTGSGVWRRNPENLRQFDCTQITHYQKKQAKILTNALPFLEEGGDLYYITCSVFEAENEGHAALWKSLGLSCIFKKYMNTQAQGGDILFIAHLKKIHQTD
jgi:16S rRNA (cytosine967-C5)-methyltransferase